MTKDNSFPRAGRLATAATLGTALLLPFASSTAVAAIAGPMHPRASARGHHRTTVVETAATDRGVSRNKPSTRRASSTAKLNRLHGRALKTSRQDNSTARRRDIAASRHGHGAAVAVKSRGPAPRSAAMVKTASTVHMSRRAMRKAARLQARQAAVRADSKPLAPAVKTIATDAAQFSEDQQIAATTAPREETLQGRIASFFFGPLRGSHESLVRQNQRDQQDGLARVQDDGDITHQVAARTLVALPSTPGLRVDERLPVNRRYTRPWTAHFLADVARAHAAAFNADLQVNSAVRTVEFQKHLVHINGNAAPADGDNASSHLMGGTVDLAKKGMSAQEVQWMRAYLSALQAAGKIDVEEEFQQACFHVAVYKSYLPAVPQRLVAADTPTRLRAPATPTEAEN